MFQLKTYDSLNESELDVLYLSNYATFSTDCTVLLSCVKDKVIGAYILSWNGTMYHIEIELLKERMIENAKEWGKEEQLSKALAILYNGELSGFPPVGSGWKKM